MTDTIIRGGAVVANGNVEILDIAIRDGRIERVGHHLGVAAQVIDATGLVVLPGLVDAHVHLRDPGFTHKEDFHSGTRAAAASGVTTVVAQPNTNPAVTTVDAFNEMRQIGAARAIVDFGISAAATEDNIQELAGLVRAGALSIDFALGGSAPALTVRSNAKLVEILQTVASLGTLATVYTADADIGNAQREDMIAAGRRDALAFADAFPAVTEALGAARLLAAAIPTGARVHIRQVSCPETLQVAAAFRPLLQPNQLTIEVTPHHLYLTRDVIAEQGALAIMGPPLRRAADTAALREALRVGSIDMVCTDHAPHTIPEKEAGRDDVWKTAPGTPGLETFLPSLLAAVDRGEMSLPDLARIASERPAEIFGLAGRKGAIRAGLDADLVLVDPDCPHPVEPSRFHSKAHYSPFSGELRGKLHRTIVRGTTVYDGAFRVAPGFGRFLTP